MIPKYTQNFNISYTPGFNYAYLIHRCNTSLFYVDGGICSNCTASYCSACVVSVDKCSTCIDGYIFDINNDCIINSSSSINFTEPTTN